ncbi:hypothetical protein L7F22_016831 [Adiantum nelumboides]|nr:hypothetical protein [Adiantum nelumboides]
MIRKQSALPPPLLPALFWSVFTLSIRYFDLSLGPSTRGHSHRVDQQDFYLKISFGKSSKVKTMDRPENSLKESSRDLSSFKFKSGGVVAIVLIVVFGLLNSLFEGDNLYEDVPNIGGFSLREIWVAINQDGGGKQIMHVKFPRFRNTEVFGSIDGCKYASLSWYACICLSCTRIMLCSNKSMVEKIKAKIYFKMYIHQRVESSKNLLAKPSFMSYQSLSVIQLLIVVLFHSIKSCTGFRHCPCTCMR